RFPVHERPSGCETFQPWTTLCAKQRPLTLRASRFGEASHFGNATSTMRCMFKVLAALLLSTSAILTVESAQSLHFDVLIRNGRVMDGSGNPWLRADVGINGDRIAAIGHLAGATATRTIDARDHIVAPGFIDVHSHAAEGLRNPALHQAQPLLAQGVTT